jgi:hypothetical protein
MMDTEYPLNERDRGNNITSTDNYTIRNNSQLAELSGATFEQSSLSYSNELNRIVTEVGGRRSFHDTIFRICSNISINAAILHSRSFPVSKEAKVELLLKVLENKPQTIEGLAISLDISAKELFALTPKERWLNLCDKLQEYYIFDEKIRLILLHAIVESVPESITAIIPKLNYLESHNAADILNKIQLYHPLEALKNSDLLSGCYLFDRNQLVQNIIKNDPGVLTDDKDIFSSLNRDDKKIVAFRLAEDDPSALLKCIEQYSDNSECFFECIDIIIAKAPEIVVEHIEELVKLNRQQTEIVIQQIANTNPSCLVDSLETINRLHIPVVFSSTAPLTEFEPKWKQIFNTDTRISFQDLESLKSLFLKVAENLLESNNHAVLLEDLTRFSALSIEQRQELIRANVTRILRNL